MGTHWTEEQLQATLACQWACSASMQGQSAQAPSRGPKLHFKPRRAPSTARQRIVNSCQRRRTTDDGRTDGRTRVDSTATDPRTRRTMSRMTEMAVVRLEDV